MSSAAKLILRDAQSQERSAITEVLAAAFADSAVARWIDPDPVTRFPCALDYFRTTVDGAMSAGVARVADERGEILAAALWFPHPPVGSPPAGSAFDGAAFDQAAFDRAAFDRTAFERAAFDRAAFVDRGVVERCRLLRQLLDERHPFGPAHHHLAYLGVRPDRQRQGIGSYLLIGHHAYLHVAGIPAYLEANDPRNRELYLRHGYTDVGAPIMLPDGTPIWPMWRPPVPAGAIASAAIVSSSEAPLARLARFSFE